MPTGATPFSLVYGFEVILPLEVGIPSLWDFLKGLNTDEDYRVMKIQDLELQD